MAAKFQLKKAKNGKIYFNLLSSKGEVILTSQMYASKATAKKGIAAVRVNSQEKTQFERRINKKGQHYFVLKAKNHQVIGHSEAYSGAAIVNRRVTSAMRNAPRAMTEDMYPSVSSEQCENQDRQYSVREKRETTDIFFRDDLVFSGDCPADLSVRHDDYLYGDAR